MSEDGNLNYRYGNGTFGPIKIDGDSIEIDNLASTLMYVEMEPSESTVSESIRSAKKFKVEGNKLHLFDASGNVVVELEKA